MGELVKVGRLDDFREGRGAAVRLDDKRVAIFKIGGRLHAIQDSCPHMGASLADGRVEQGAVVCHWHGWRFDLKSGQGDRRKETGFCAKVYEVKVDGGDVYLRRPDAPPPKQEEDEWVPWSDDFLKSK